MRYSSKTLHILKPLISEDDDIHFLKNIDSICVEIEKNSENKNTLCKKANDILGKNFPKKIYHATLMQAVEHVMVLIKMIGCRICFLKY